MNFYLQRKEHKLAHPWVMYLTQEPEKRSTISASEIGAQAAYLFFFTQTTLLLFTQNRSPMHCTKELGEGASSACMRLQVERDLTYTQVKGRGEEEHR
jgi:hypothetical protein